MLTGKPVSDAVCFDDAMDFNCNCTVALLDAWISLSVVNIWILLSLKAADFDGKADIFVSLALTTDGATT